jgi:hypothetical protein
MVHVLIRTCKRDEYLARLCYESFITAGIDAKYSFLTEPGKYEYLTDTNANIIEKGFCDNYTGQVGAHGIVSDIKKYSVNPDDIVIISDSDIVVFENFIDKLVNIDHAGVINRTRWGLNHVSGQMQILRGSIFLRLSNLTSSDISKIVDEMVALGIDVADDTFISFVTDSLGAIKLDLLGYWIHSKFHQYSGNRNFAELINTIKKQN